MILLLGSVAVSVKRLPREKDLNLAEDINISVKILKFKYDKGAIDRIFS